MARLQWSSINLSSENYGLRKCDWSGVHIYFSDERIVNEDHPDNTATMIRNTLAIPLNLPLNGVHPIPTHMGAHLAAEKYNEALVALKESIDGPLFHLSILGLGPDGHIASLFPGSTALRERTRYVVPGGKGPEGWERVTLTKPAIELSDLIWIVAAGQEKMRIINKMINGPLNPDAFPLQIIDHKKNQVVLWLGDKSIDVW